MDVKTICQISKLDTFYFKVSRKQAFFNLNVEPVDFHEQKEKNAVSIMRSNKTNVMLKCSLHECFKIESAKVVFHKFRILH